MASALELQPAGADTIGPDGERWNVFGVLFSHNDIGWAGKPAEVADHRVSVIDEALDLLDISESPSRFSMEAALYLRAVKKHDRGPKMSVRIFGNAGQLARVPPRMGVAVADGSEAGDSEIPLKRCDDRRRTASDEVQVSLGLWQIATLALVPGVAPGAARVGNRQDGSAGSVNTTIGAERSPTPVRWRRFK